MIKSFIIYEDAIQYIDELVYDYEEEILAGELMVELRFVNHHWQVGVRKEITQMELPLDSITD